MEILTLILFTCFILYSTGVIILLFLGMLGLTLKPVIIIKQNVIIAQYSNVYLFLTFFLCIKNLKIDLTNATLRLSVKKCWILNNVKIIKFSEISKIKYDHLSYWNMRGEDRPRIEEFVVSLILTNDNIVKLFSFIGNDRDGSQDDNSREFAELISVVMDKKVDSDSVLLAKARSNMDKIKCVSCGHFNLSSNKKCLYCDEAVSGTEAG